MLADPGLRLFAVAVALSVPAPPSSASMVAMPLCGGGIVHIRTGSTHPRDDPSSACHAACAQRRDDDDNGQPDDDI